MGYNGPGFLLAERLASLLQNSILCGVLLEGLVVAKSKDVYGEARLEMTAGNNQLHSRRMMRAVNEVSMSTNSSA